MEHFLPVNDLLIQGINFSYNSFFRIRQTDMISYIFTFNQLIHIRFLPNFTFWFMLRCADMPNKDELSPSFSASTLSQEASPYILLQRISTQRWNPSNWFAEHQRPFDGLYNNFLLELESKVRHKQICKQYLDQMETEYHELKPHLPESVSSILDIGCGMAGIDLFLWDHFENDEPDIVLFDKTKRSDELYYRFYDQAAFYNSLHIAEENLSNGEIPENRIHTVEASSENLRNLDSVDFCLSLYSWGFHYPVKTYIDDVLQVINQDGRVVLDLRKESGQVTKETDGYRACENAFDTINIIEDAHKYKRFILSDPVKTVETERSLEESDEKPEIEETEPKPAEAV